MLEYLPELLKGLHTSLTLTVASIVVALVLALVFCCSATVRAEGFALNEWSARGVSLAGGLVGRADDVSALAYNAAGITQVPGSHILGGLAFIAPMGTIVADHPGPWRSAEMDLAPCGFGAARIMIKSGSSAIPISAISYKSNSLYACFIRPHNQRQPRCGAKVHARQLPF